MIKSKLHIEVVRSTLPKLSSMSLVSGEAICRLLQLHYEQAGISTVNNLEDLKQLVKKQPDIVFMGLKFIYHNGQKIWVSEYLEKAGIRHTGSPKAAIEFEQNKSLAKQRIINAGLASSAFMVVKHGQVPNTALELQYPLFVKPVNLGGGSGVDDRSIVYNIADLQAKLATLFSQFSSDALIEEYLPGREFSVAVLKDISSGELEAMPIEMKPSADTNGDKILSLALKSGKLETPVTSVPESHLRQQLISIAVSAFMALGARDYGRIDVRLNASGMPYFLEANLIPGLIKGSGNFTKACLINNALDYDEMILKIVRLAEARIISSNLLKSSGIRAVVAQW